MNAEDQDRFFAAMVGMKRDSTVILEPVIRIQLTQALGLMMSDISEGQYAAGWLGGLEDRLPYQLMAEASGGQVVQLPYEPGETVPIAVARVMVGMATILGHWAKYEGDTDRGDMFFVPYTPATAKLTRQRKKHQAIARTGQGELF